MEKEIWKDIKGYEGLYQVSNLGNVKSIERFYKLGNNIIKVKEKNIKGNKNTYGYLSLTLCNKGIRKNVTIHHLVAQAFIPNPLNKPTINHIDGNKLNNNVSNLEWATNSEQLKHAYNNNLRKKPYKELNNMFGKYGSKHHRSKKVYQYDLDGNLIKVWENAYEIKRELNYSQSEINKCCLNKKDKAYNYMWKYTNKECESNEKIENKNVL